MKELDFEYIGKRLREIRILKGLTQGYVASCADVNTSHISNIENNRVKVSLTTLVHMCNALDVTVDYVLHNEYVNSQSPLENSILIELQHCDKQKQERMLKLISVLKEHDLL